MATQTSPREGEKSQQNTIPHAKGRSNKTLWIVLGIVAFFVVVVPSIVGMVVFVWLRNNVQNGELGQKALEGIVEQTTGGAVDLDSNNGSFTVRDKEGNTSFGVGNQELPDDFPKNEIPFIDQKSVSFVTTSTNEGKKNWSVSTVVSQSPSSAASYFESQFVEPTYTEINTLNVNGIQSFSATSTKYSINVNVSAGDVPNEANVLYSVSEM